MRCIFQNENFEAFLCPAMYLCGIHFFDNYIFLKGVTFLYALTSIPVWIEYSTMITTIPVHMTVSGWLGLSSHAAGRGFVPQLGHTKDHSGACVAQQ